jgi:hypothetical protein
MLASVDLAIRSLAKNLFEMNNVSTDFFMGHSSIYLYKEQVNNVIIKAIERFASMEYFIKIRQIQSIKIERIFHNFINHTEFNYHSYLLLFLIYNKAHFSRNPES